MAPPTHLLLSIYSVPIYSPVPIDVEESCVSDVSLFHLQLFFDPMFTGPVLKRPPTLS
jgi:hypothetical protein